MSATNKIWASLVVCAGLILVFKFLFREPVKNEQVIQEFWIEKTHSSQTFDVAICGDSRIYRGISPNQLEETLDGALKGINLGYSSAGYSDEYLDFAVSKLDKAAPHRILVLGVTPHSLTKEAFKNEHFHSFKDLGPFELFKTRYLSPVLTYFQVYKPSNVIRGSKETFLEDYHEDGWVASSRINADTSEALASYQKIFSGYQVEAAEVNSFLEKVSKLTANGVQVVAFRPPTTAAMRAMEDSLSGFDEAFVQAELQKRSVTWVELRPSDFESYDGSHLHHNSAKELSRIIGLRLKELYLASSENPKNNVVE